ncbi:S-formylglutathione hydrolase [Emcibacter nanhaiensis]|uniref:S-formylglutathione hydrolase n=1 Tax=Emcibacter nanhaiensis TaxID=1505037 RepID=A0A501PH05_9PROT|nr:S-formylglutathione hydrolase [Emcibacter nanhaiensis]TPD59146.1 S-formylglutathione hydrolase [Emcibacter nanhaiensis]
MSDLIVGEHRCFDGRLLYCEHQSAVTNCRMRFSLYLPPAAAQGPVPLVTWLSGLTCTEENFTAKAGAYKKASELGLAILAPDTSPRGEGVADDEGYDMGQGAGFYVDSTEAPWKPHFQMYSYITRELRELVLQEFPVDSHKLGIFGHSMGGHGALTIYLKNQDIYKSVSAFAPIVSPMNCPWGHKALGGYIGEDREGWRQYDSCELIQALGEGLHRSKILVDQGLADAFLEEQLKPELFEKACAKVGQKLTLRRHEGYDHGYFFIQTFMDDHLAHHAALLG